MYKYVVRMGHGSNELLIEFKSRASDADFRHALGTALSPVGIELLWDGNYLNSKNTVSPSPLKAAFVESDQWDFVWAGSCGQTNKEDIVVLERALAKSDRFSKG
ncbi:hypothetical protein [Rugamonas sp.]|uniref:hypothetical protein n=1 Tax=Rugamonas sp. TaxID=1926287 RepID=UPI0025E46B72|nr:hypothetical protein [Rugamonas sp.]